MSITAAGTAEVATADQQHGHQPQGSLAKLMVGAVGIVFGDIGTSPIYAFRETFAGHHSLEPDPLHIYGVLSLIFWSMLIIVALKYVTVIMRADNKGEGGSLALLALINRTVTEGEKKKWTMGIVLLGVFATALFYGDSMITPAISVLSAVEGLTTVQAGFEPYVIPTAVGILVGLFAIQSRGTAKVGLLFGPIMLVYFVTLAVLGGMHIVKHPQVLIEMFNPLNAFKFYFARVGDAEARNKAELDGLLGNRKGAGNDRLAGDDRGHRRQDDQRQPQRLRRQEEERVPDCRKRLRGALRQQHGALAHIVEQQRRHDEIEPGQIYIPIVNWALMIMVILLVLMFGSSSNLAAAYGIAVTGAMLIDGVLISVLLFSLWKWPMWKALPLLIVFFTIDILYFGANLLIVLGDQALAGLTNFGIVGVEIEAVVEDPLFAVATAATRGEQNSGDQQENMDGS